VTNYFKVEEDQNISLSPATIVVKSLQALVDENFTSKSLIIGKVTSLYGKSSLTLNDSDKISFDCNNCGSTGMKNIKFSINNKARWITAEFLIKTKAYKAKSGLSTMTPILIAKDFVEVNISDKGYIKYFNDIKNVRFYRLNKYLRKGDLIKAHDMSPKTLIKYGQRVSIAVKSGLINVKTIGMAKKSGKIGDFIEIQNLKTKKIILGKIVDFNKVMVEL